MSLKKVRRAEENNLASDPHPAETPPATMFPPVVGPWMAGASLIVALTFIAYIPALPGDFVFDDAYWTTSVEKLLRDFSGLWQIWTHATALQQYYPLTGTTFWLDYHLWHWWTLPYHIENVLLHAGNALLLWRLLEKLEIPGAWLAGALFALHPVMVESVAWITERKNLLSMILLLAALLAYGRYTSFWKEKKSPPRQRDYFLALLFFVGALLSKITAVALPPVILLLAWWKRGSIGWKRDVRPALPFFVMAFVLGVLVAWLEKHHVGAHGAEWELSWAQRILVAGRAPWFYAGKLLWPHPLCLIYPKWNADPGSWWQWLFPAGTLALLWLAWRWRGSMGRGPATALFYFMGTLLPVLGLMNFYWMRFSFVGDHLVYLSSPGLLAPVATLVVQAGWRLRGQILPASFVLLVLPALAVLTWREARLYRNAEILWRVAFTRNPECWLASNNLGAMLLHNGQIEKATGFLRKALELNPTYAEAHSNLGNALLRTGRTDEAAACYETALKLNPRNAGTFNNLGELLLLKGRFDEAITQYQKSLAIDPESAMVRKNLGNAYLQKGDAKHAIVHFQAALQIKPNFAGAEYNLGNAFVLEGRVSEAVVHYEKSLELAPEDLDTLNYLAWILATSPDSSTRDGARALELAQTASLLPGGNHPQLLYTLAAAYAESGRFTDADETAERALTLAVARGDGSMAEVIRNGRKVLQAGKPLRDDFLAPAPAF